MRTAQHKSAEAESDAGAHRQTLLHLEARRDPITLDVLINRPLERRHERLVLDPRHIPARFQARVCQISMRGDTWQTNDSSKRAPGPHLCDLI